MSAHPLTPSKLALTLALTLVACGAPAITSTAPALRGPRISPHTLETISHETLPPLGSVASAPAELRRAAARTTSIEDRPTTHHVLPGELCMTNGRLRPPSPSSKHTFSVDAGGMRAVVAGESLVEDASAELAFTYLRPSTKTTPLSSGEERRQVGLKLRAKNTCNVLYVMWRIAPDHGIFVSLKRNDGMGTHEECGANGYKGVKPTKKKSLPPINAGESHTLRAELDRFGELHVFADGVDSWQAKLPEELSALAGPIGLRSDNAAFDFDLHVDSRTMRVATCDSVER